MDDEKIVIVVHKRKDEDEKQNQNGQKNKKEEDKEIKEGKGVQDALKQGERTCTAMIPQLGASGSGVPN